MLEPGKKPLLVIEDSDEDFEALRRMMSRSPRAIPVYRCSNGDEALDFLYREGEYRDRAKVPRPSMILLDLNLPGTDGREVLEQIKQDRSLKTIPVVVFTTSSNPRDIENCYQNGANSYILKPMEIGKLKKEVKTLIDYWFETVVLCAEARP
ncbi:MAG: response regulator [Cyanobacteriota bacterium]|nr:response regulator [Cyanobacteriota bacterium]